MLTGLAHAEFSNEYPEKLPPDLTLVQALLLSDLIIEDSFKDTKFGVVRTFCMKYPKPQKGFENKWSIVYINENKLEIIITITYPKLHGYLWSAKSAFHPNGMSKRFSIKRIREDYSVVEEPKPEPSEN